MQREADEVAAREGWCQAWLPRGTGPNPCDSPRLRVLQQEAQLVIARPSEGPARAAFLLPPSPDNKAVTFFRHLSQWKNVIDKLCMDNCYFG